jgi:large subunit ribosomal protein L3
VIELPFGILAKKLGMTGLLLSDGKRVPVTVLRAGPCPVTGVRTKEKNGYEAVQLGFLAAKKSNLSKAMEGYFSTLSLSPVRILREFRPLGGSAAQTESLKVGDEVKADAFEAGDFVDIRGVTKGKGFAGTVKRHHFGRGPTSHGSKSHRRPGSTGATDAARVFKGKRSPGHMGAKNCSSRGLKLVRIDVEKGLLFVRGTVPGPSGGVLEVRPSRKQALK